MKQLYCIPKPDRINDFVQFAKDYNAGFEYNDFFIPDVLDHPDIVKNLLGAYKKIDRDRSEDTLHGVFLDMCVNSTDSLIYAATNQRIHQSMDIAMELGVKAVVFHTNHIPNFMLHSYREGWIDLNEKYWRKLLAEYPKLSVYMENMFDEEPELLRRLAERMADEPRFAVCFDFAHAFISRTSLQEWCNSLTPYIRHLHINDNDGIEDTHHPVGSCRLPWDVYNAYIAGIPAEKRPTVLIEVRSFPDLTESVRFMQEHRMYPLA